jgi:two-component system chemotaxis response regulator CheY
VRALVVDDSMVMRKVLIGALSRVQISDIDQAVDGVEAVDFASKQKYDIILMDWNMPNKNGLEAVIEIRASENKTPIVMVTTEAEKANIVTALKAGANNYVVKPFEPNVIVDKIKAAMAEEDD